MKTVRELIAQLSELSEIHKDYYVGVDFRLEIGNERTITGGTLLVNLLDNRDDELKVIWLSIRN